MPTFKGFDVLTDSPHYGGDPTDRFSRSAALFDPGNGKVTSSDHGPSPIGVHRFGWFITSKADAAAVRAFFNARKGMAVPFWVPSWRPDLSLTADVPSSTSGITVKAAGYTTFSFPTPARRYLAFLLADGTQIYRKVTDSVNNGNGTESLTLESAPGVTLPFLTTGVCFLMLCRLNSDRLAIAWESQQVAQCMAEIIEVPLEVPA